MCMDIDIEIETDIDIGTDRDIHIDKGPKQVHI